MTKLNTFSFRSKLISTEIIIENEKSYEVKTYETSKPGEIFQQKIEVNKDYFQKQIDKLQSQIDALNQKKDQCYE